MCGFAIDKLPLVKITKFRLIFYLFLCNLSIDKIPLCKLENFGIYFFYFLCNFSIDKNALHVIYWNFAPQRTIGTRKRRAIIPHFSVLVNRQSIQKSKKTIVHIATKPHVNRQTAQIFSAHRAFFICFAFWSLVNRQTAQIFFKFSRKYSKKRQTLQFGVFNKFYSIFVVNLIQFYT